MTIHSVPVCQTVKIPAQSGFYSHKLNIIVKHHGESRHVVRDGPGEMMEIN